MKKLFVVMGICALFLSATSAFSDNLQVGAKAGTLMVSVDGFPSDQGVAKIALVNSIEGYEDSAKAFMKETVEIVNGKATCNFNHVPFGKYAVTVRHDENNNNKIDKSIFGKPTEAYGFSNNVRRFFGKPAYEKAVFILDQSDKVIKIEVK
jgi:uncharacterized protein (DUF2141 family)